MARFRGRVGFGHQVETPAGSDVWKTVITERTYSGEIIKESRNFSATSQVNPSLNLRNRVSIISDDFSKSNIISMVYVIVDGSYWRISDVEISYPRLILSLNGEYNGPKA